MTLRTPAKMNKSARGHIIFDVIDSKQRSQPLCSYVKPIIKSLTELPYVLADVSWSETNDFLFHCF